MLFMGKSTEHQWENLQFAFLCKSTIPMDHVQEPFVCLPEGITHVREQSYEFMYNLAFCYIGIEHCPVKLVSFA